MRFFTFCWVCALPMFAWAGNPDGARSAGMGNASVASTDLFSCSSNQAGLATVRNLSAAMSYENQYLLKDLSVRSFGLAVPALKGTFALSLTSYGNMLYNEKKIGMAYAKSFGERFSAGMQFDYLSLNIADGYGSSGKFMVEVGLQAALSKQILWGVHIYNPSRTKLSDYQDEHIPTVVKTGISNRLSAKVSLNAEVEKDILLPAIFKVGLEYSPTKQLYLRTGMNTGVSIFSFGFGLRYSSFRLDVASSLHSQLGYSPQVSLVYEVD